MNRKKVLLLIAACLFFGTFLSVGNASIFNVLSGSSTGETNPTQEQGGDPDLDGLNTFSQALKNNSNQVKSYLDKGFSDYYKKLSNSIKKDRRLESISNQCLDCEYLLEDTLDGAMVQYIENNYDLLTQQLDRNAFESDIGTLAIAEHFDPQIETFTFRDIQVIDSISSDLTLSIVDQIRHQSDTFEAFGIIGLDHDGLQQSSGSNATSESIASLMGITSTLLAIGIPGSDSGRGHPDNYNALHRVFSRIICDPYPADKGFINNSFNAGGNVLDPSILGTGFANEASGIGGNSSSDNIQVNFQKNTSLKIGNFFQQHCAGKKTFETMNRDNQDYAARELANKNLECNRQNPHHKYQPKGSNTSYDNRKWQTNSSGATVDVKTQTPPRNRGAYYNTRKNDVKTPDEKRKQTIEWLTGIAHGNGFDFPGNTLDLFSDAARFNQREHAITGTPSEITRSRRENIGELESIASSQPSFAAIAGEVQRAENEYLQHQMNEIEEYAISQHERGERMQDIQEHLAGKQECV